MFLLTGCDCGGAGILKIIKFVWQLLDIAFFVIPIGLIVMVTVDFAKNVIAGKEDDMRKNVSIAIKRFMYAVALFLVPTIVNFAINVVGNLGIAYTDCITIAKEHDLSQYETCKIFENTTGNTNNANNNGSTENTNDNTGNSEETRNKDDYYFKSSTAKCQDYQPSYKNDLKLKKSGLIVKNITTFAQSNGLEGKEAQKIWTTGDDEYYVWIGNGNCGGNYLKVSTLVGALINYHKSTYYNSKDTVLNGDYFYENGYQPRYFNNKKLENNINLKVGTYCLNKENELKGHENQKVWEYYENGYTIRIFWDGDNQKYLKCLDSNDINKGNTSALN